MLPRGNGQTVRLSRGASLTDFAEKINANPASLVQVMLNLGEMVTATQSVSDDTLELLAGEMNYVLEIVSPEEEDRELLESFDIEFGEDEGGEEALVSRPPVVTVMGHVDHGKTRLLDAIRKTNVVAGEAGGITQHIGAYQVATEVNGDERRITFIDTPGHEAFTAMRARGAKSTDIAILVVAANDGVMPQTIEALNHAKAAEVPIVVAVNKIDVEGADPTKVRGQLTEFGLVAEEYGGDTMFVDISAKQGLNIDSLLEAVVLTADASLDLRANPEQDAQGIAIEAHLDQRPRRRRDRPGPARHPAGRRHHGGRRRVRPGPGDARRQGRQRRGGDPVDSGARPRSDQRARAPATTSWSSTRTARPVRSPRSGPRASATSASPARASGSPWRTWTRRSRPVWSRSSTSSSRATRPVRWRLSSPRCSSSTSAKRSTSGSCTAVWVRSPSRTSTWRPAPTPS